MYSSRIPQSLVWFSSIAWIYAVTAARKLSDGTIVTADVGYRYLVIGALTILTLAWATRVYREAVA